MTMQVEYTELKNMYFDKKVSDYFSQVFDIPAKNTADCQALMKGQIKDISAEDLTPEVKDIVSSICQSFSVSSCCSLSLSLSLSLFLSLVITMNAVMMGRRIRLTLISLCAPLIHR